MSKQYESIQNLEQAKRYFIAMGCSHFNLDREDFKLRDEYSALNISLDTEMKWRQQEVKNRFNTFPLNEPEKIGLFYNRLNDMINRDREHLERMLALANNFIDILPHEQIRLVLSVIIGNNGTLSRGGLIEGACKIGLYDLAQRFITCAKTFIDKAEDNNISIMGLRGYLVDVIKALGLKERNDYLNILRIKDNIENFKYYHQGAKEGNVFSMRMLAKHYEDGKGCERDSSQAIYWLTQASDLGNSLAKNELSEFNKRNTSVNTRGRFEVTPFW